MTTKFSRHWHNATVTRLLHSAAGDLALDGLGHLRYRMTWGDDGLDLPSDVLRFHPEVLARITIDGWQLTAAGAYFILDCCPPKNTQGVAKLCAFLDTVEGKE